MKFLFTMQILLNNNWKINNFGRFWPILGYFERFWMILWTILINDSSESRDFFFRWEVNTGFRINKKIKIWFQFSWLKIIKETKKVVNAEDVIYLLKLLFKLILNNVITWNKSNDFLSYVNFQSSKLWYKNKRRI